MEWFARLKIERAVLYLYQHIFPELAVERFELVVRLFGPVCRCFVAVNKSAPHHDAIVRRERIGKHVCAVGVGALIILRPGLSF